MENKELPTEITAETQIASNKESVVAAITDAINRNDNKSLKQILSAVHYADLADYINFATVEQKHKILKILGNKLPPEILLEFKIDILLSVIEILGKKLFATLTNKLPIEDVLHLLEDFSYEERQKVIANLSPQKQKVISKALTYPKNCAGLLMERKYVCVKASISVGDVLSYLAGNEDLPEKYDEIFILDDNNQPIGIVPISKLIKARHSEKIENIMQTDIQVIDEFLDQEEVSYVFRHYDIKSAPVINQSKKMIGVVHIDQIVEVVEEEAEEDIMRMGGISITDLYSALFKTAKHRFPWLFFNLITACIASTVVMLFTKQISKLAVLAAIMPIVTSMGGNAGTQSTTVSVRAIANKDIINSNMWQVVLKEMLSALLNGALLAILGGLMLFPIYKNYKLCVIFGIAVLANFTLAGVWGSLIPISLHRCGLDPAISSSVFVTFLTDLLGFFIFLSLAAVFL